ncbi:hypothetical protein H0H87_008547 [Tephrocybe sp. NHM501043]|nr:hypothetical protein H0H87_008547 [Tephrocybe sp. NHM501043]
MLQKLWKPKPKKEYTERSPEQSDAEAQSPPLDGEFRTQQAEASQKLSKEDHGEPASPPGSPERQSLNFQADVDSRVASPDKYLRIGMQDLSFSDAMNSSLKRIQTSDSETIPLLPQGITSQDTSSSTRPVISTVMALRTKEDDGIFLRTLHRSRLNDQNPEKRKSSHLHPTSNMSKTEVERSWPLKPFSKRQPDTIQWPRIFFDITWDPTEPTQNGLYLFDDESGSYLSEDSLDQCLQLKFSPDCEFTMLRLKSDEAVLDQWDIQIERQDGIRVIDVLQGIYEVYNVPLNSREYGQLYDLIQTPGCRGAFERRAKHIPLIKQKTLKGASCRVDLVKDKTLFSGIYYDDEFHQYYFQLSNQHPTHIHLSK